MMSGVTDAAGRENAETPLVLAIDVGTSSVRAALYDERAVEISGAESRLERSLWTTPGGGAEDEAERSVEHVALTIDALLAQASALASRIESVAVSCFWHSLVGIDLEGRAVTPLYGWADTRAALWAQELRRRFDERTTHARTGCRFHSSYWPARLLWLREERPRPYSAARRWMSFAEFLVWRFFGVCETSVSMASGTGMLDLRSCAWDAELLAGLELDADRLPEIIPKHKSLTGLAKAYARRWPALKSVPWFLSIGDGAANNIGAGCVTRACVALMVGTSGAMRVLWRGEPPGEFPLALWCYRADRDRVILGGALSDGGGLYAWMREALFLGDDEQAIMLELASMEPDAHGLTLLPFWAGERSPGWATHARGAILGLSMHTRPLEILRAAMEAVAYRFALIARALVPLAPDALMVASGGALAASPVWMQIIADALGRPVKLSGLKEASSRGAVLLALEATGKISCIEDAPAPLATVYEPDMARHERYLLGLERQQKLYEHLIADRKIAESVYGAGPTANSQSRSPRD
ncbi:MAG TPA: gluconokinase [Pyrinomonadaceae bacterium]|jgi:gluconokinase|nr:gluconokinase [Pyrinomonadaceae bacterium]